MDSIPKVLCFLLLIVAIYSKTTFLMWVAREECHLECKKIDYAYHVVCFRKTVYTLKRSIGCQGYMKSRMRFASSDKGVKRKDINR